MQVVAILPSHTARFVPPIAGLAQIWRKQSKAQACRRLRADFRLFRQHYRPQALLLESGNRYLAGGVQSVLIGKLSLRELGSDLLKRLAAALRLLEHDSITLFEKVGLGNASAGRHAPSWLA